MDIKSEKIQIKSKIIIMWIIVAALVFIQFSLAIIDYTSYKKGQKFAIISLGVASELSEAKIINADDSYEDKCESLYDYFSRDYEDVTINGVRYDYSKLRQIQKDLKETMYNLMNNAGYDRFSSYCIEYWFKYTDFFQYFRNYSLHNILFYIVYGILLLALILTIILAIIRQKELIVSENFLVCKYNKKKSKLILIKEIVGVESYQNRLKLSGNGFKYNIPLISNAGKLKSEIMKRMIDLKANDDKEIHVQKTQDIAPTSNADELKKYKDLFDSGVITQEEFDAKKKQLLNL